MKVQGLDGIRYMVVSGTDDNRYAWTVYDKLPLTLNWAACVNAARVLVGTATESRVERRKR